MGKLSLTLYDRIFVRDKYREIFILRSQIEIMSKLWRNIDIVTQLTNYREINREMHQATMFSLDEERMKEVLGENAVIQRLTNDRNKILTLLKNVKEINLSEIHKQIREEKLKEIGI